MFAVSVVILAERRPAPLAICHRTFADKHARYDEKVRANLAGHFAKSTRHQQTAQNTIIQTVSKKAQLAETVSYICDDGWIGKNHPAKASERVCLFAVVCGTAHCAQPTLQNLAQPRRTRIFVMHCDSAYRDCSIL